MDQKLSAEVWTRLIDGKSISDLGLPMFNGRIDLRGLSSPEVASVRQCKNFNSNVEELGGFAVLRNVRLKNLDISESNLKSLRFHDCSIENCHFIEAICQDWRLWGTAISNTSFKSADMRKAALGAVHDGKRNSFRSVDFTMADLRNTSNASADFVGCVFSDTRLTKVDFQGCVFVDCSFEGELNEVLFYSNSFNDDKMPTNKMEGVDLSRARLRHVEFRGLDMDDVKWPNDDEHIIINEYRGSLERMLNDLRNRPDIKSKRLMVVLEMKRKWAGSNQKTGVISKLELEDIGGQEAVEYFLSLYRQY